MSPSRFALLVSFFATSAFSQTSLDSCTPSSEDLQFHTEIARSPNQIELLRKKLETTPDDLFLNRWLIENRQLEKGTLAAEYRKKLDDHPASALYLYLYGDALIGTDTTEALRQLNLAITQDPKLPWTYHSLLELYSNPTSHDPAKVADNLLAFTGLCPDSLETYNFIRFVEDREKLRELTVRFRRAVNSRSTTGVGADYRRLWAAEFRATDPTAFDPLRAQVQKDIERIKELDPDNTEALREGYQLIGDTAAANALPPPERTLPRSFHTDYDAWSKAHPYPKAGASQQERDKFYTEQAEAAAQWVKDWPDDLSARQWRLSSLAKLQTTPNQELETAGDALLNTLKQHPFKGFLIVPFQTSVAQIWNERDIRLEQCLQLTDEALAEIDQSAKANPAFAKIHAYQVATGLFETLRVQSTVARKLKNFAKARAALDRMSHWLDENSGDYPNLSHTYLTESAFLSEAQGRKPDSQLEQRKKLAVANQPSPWSDMSKSLSALNAYDNNGKVWTISDLRGKTTLLNIWATWCAPCRAELPAVQRLFDQTKDQKEIQVVTISVDGNPGIIDPFLKEGHYTFPVILAQGPFVDEVAGQIGIPRTWIVDSNGTVRLERLGYDPADWPQEILQKMTTLKPAH